MHELGGLNPHHAVAGFGGGLAAIWLFSPESRWATVGLIVVGVLTAMYLTPVVVEVAAHAGIPYTLSKTAELGLAFMLGLTSMVFLPAVIGFATWVRDTISTLTRIKIYKPSKPRDK